MSTITRIQRDSETPGRRIAREIVDTLHDEAQRRAAVHQLLFRKLWFDPDTSPESVFEELGGRGKAVLDAATANVQHIAAIAPLLGKTLADYLKPEDYTRPRDYTESGGIITLTPLPE